MGINIMRYIREQYKFLQADLIDVQCRKDWLDLLRIDTTPEAERIHEIKSDMAGMLARFPELTAA
jgi:hypothetical protein